jgi:hypothetical protein
MKYKVTFRQRFNEAGQPSDAPNELADVELADDVVLDSVFVERTEPGAQHSEEVLEEDDNFLAFGTATWIYDVAEGREREFIDALKNTELALQIEELRDTPDYLASV